MTNLTPLGTILMKGEENFVNNGSLRTRLQEDQNIIPRERAFYQKMNRKFES